MSEATSPSSVARPIRITFRRSVDVTLRFVIAGSLLAVLTGVGFQNVGGLVGWIFLGITLPAAAMWATRRISGMAMFNVTVAVASISAITAASDPGLGSMDQIAVMVAGAIAAVLTWLILLNNRLGEEDDPPRSLAPLLVAPALLAGTVALLRTDLPGSVRFSASKASLDRFAAEALADKPRPIDAIGEDLNTSVNVGLYQVIGASIDQTPGGPALNLVLAGDCGWFADCTIPVVPGSDPASWGPPP